MNSIILIGRPTGTPTVTYTPSQMAIAKFSLAVDRDRKSKDGEKEADFFDVTAFGKTAESCERYAAKGKMLAVKGRAQIDSFKGKDGQTRKAFVVIADQVQFIEWPDRDQKPQPKKPVWNYIWVRTRSLRLPTFCMNWPNINHWE